MKSILEVSTNIDDYQEIFQLLDCYLQAANTLYHTICAGLFQNQKSPTDFSTNDYWHQQLIPTFYLLKHELELAIKALVKEAKDIEVK